MGEPKPAMSIVPVLLRTVARVVGCSVDCFQMSVRRNEWLNLDVWDEEFDGAVSRETLTPALLNALSTAMGLAVLDGGSCTNEGGTLSLQITWQDSDVVLRVGF